MNKDILRTWIKKATSLREGESIFLPAESRDHSKYLRTQFRKELKGIAEVDPVTANKMAVYPVIRDGNYWLELKRVFGSPLLGFVKTLDGETKRITLEDPERSRRLQCMKEDGLTLEEVEGIEGELSESERSIFI